MTLSRSTPLRRSTWGPTRKAKLKPTGKVRVHLSPKMFNDLQIATALRSFDAYNAAPPDTPPLSPSPEPTP
ncbi:MAG TPA: hypothetical protein VF167_02470 [Longimicrobiaceae bacterium]